MKKKVLLFFVTTMLSIMGAKADVIPSSYYSEPAEGTYYIYNVTEGKFLMTAGINENNKALQTNPQAVALTSNGDGTYKFSGNENCYVKIGHYGGMWLWPNGTDTNVLSWTFNVEGTKTYKISATTTTAVTENNVTKEAGTYYIINESNLGDMDDAANAGVYALITPLQYRNYLMSDGIPSEYYSTTPDESGEFYLYDVVSKQFLNTASRSLTTTPTALSTITKSDDNYLISGNGSGYLKIGVSGSQYLWSDGNDSNTKWTIEPVLGDEVNKVFYIHTTNFVETNAAVASKDMYLIGTNASATKPDYSQWALITVANYNAYIEAQTYNGYAATASIPATYFTTTPVAGNTYYLYSPYASCFLYATADHAGLQNTPAAITFTANGDDLSILFSSNSKYLKYDAVPQGNTWANGNDPVAWKFESFHGATGLFFVKTLISETYQYLYAKEKEAASWGGECWPTPETGNTRYAWALISADDYTAWQNSFALDEATGYSATRDIYNVNPTVTKSMTANVWNTFVVPFDMAIPDGWTVKEPTAFDGSTLTFSDASSIEAGKPYIVNPTEAVTDFFATGVTLKKDLNNTIVGDLTMTGTYEQIAAIDYSTQDSYVIGIKNGVSSLYKVNSSVSLKPFRAYFTVEGGAAARIALNFGDETTGIKNLNPALSKGEGAVYDMQGRSVIHPTKGLYIKGGKKVMVK